MCVLPTVEVWLTSKATRCDFNFGNNKFNCWAPIVGCASEHVGNKQKIKHKLSKMVTALVRPAVKQK
jgi:hypothetical protein